MKLILDHHYPFAIATALRRANLQAQTVHELGWHALDDEELLECCSERDAALLTNNVSDFAVLAREWQAQGRSHSGLIFTSDARWPRTKNGAGAITEALSSLMTAKPTDAGLRDRVFWLGTPFVI